MYQTYGIIYNTIEEAIDGVALAALPEDFTEFKQLVPQSGATGKR